MLGKLILIGVAGMIVLAVFFVGYNLGQYETPTVDAYLQGLQIINRDSTDADLRLYKASNDFVEVKVVDVNLAARGTDKNNPTRLAAISQEQLQYLLNHQQTLTSIQETDPCPAPDTCDPDLLADPATCTLFWEDLDPDVDHPFIAGEPADTLTSRGNFVMLEWTGFEYRLGYRTVHRDAKYPDEC